MLDEWMKWKECSYSSQWTTRIYTKIFNKSWWSVDWWTCYYFWTLNLFLSSSLSHLTQRMNKNKNNLKCKRGIHFMIIIMITVIITIIKYSCLLLLQANTHVSKVKWFKIDFQRYFVYENEWVNVELYKYLYVCLSVC